MTPRPTVRPRLTAALLLLALAPAAAAGELDSGRIGWSELAFKASKLGFSVETTLSIRKLSAAELERRLIEPGPGDWLPAPETGGWLLELDSEGLGRRSRLDLILDTRGAALQRTQVETGRQQRRNRSRTYRFGPTAVHIDTRRPDRSQRGVDPSAWSDRSEWLLELPREPRGGLGLASGLFFTLAAAELLEPGDRATTYVLSKGRVMEVELTVEARERLPIDHAETDDAGTRKRDGELDTLRILLRGRGVGADAAEDEFRFLGMRGDVRVYLDAATRAPVLISGRLGWLGRAKVRLREVVLARP